MRRAVAVAAAVLLLAGCLQGHSTTRVADQLRAPGSDALLLHVHAAGAGPDPAALDAVRDELAAALPLEVRWTVLPIEQQGRAWDTDSLVALADRDSTVDPPGTVHLHVLWVPGAMPDERGIPLGVFVRPDPVVAVFSDVVDELPGHLAAVRDDVPAPVGVQRTVLLHLVGHGLGLVDCGLPARSARGDGCHSDEPGSVMAYDWGHVSGWIDRAARGDDLEPHLTAADRADLAAIR